MTDDVFYHEDLVMYIDDNNQMIHCGHVEGEAIHDFGAGNDVSTADSLPNQSSSENQIVAPNQFGDKSSDHEDSIDSLFIEADNHFETGYFEGPFRGNVFIRWNSTYYQNLTELSHPIPTVEESMSADSLKKVDRYHQLSDIVKRSSDNKMGIIKSIKKKAYAEIIGTNKLLADINCSKLKSIEKFFPGTSEQLVVYNSWLGRVTAISRDIVVKFSDGAKLRTSEESVERFEPLFNSSVSDIIFRGSCLKGDVKDLKNKSSKFLFETRNINANWLKNLHISQNKEIMIIKIIICSVKVDWLIYKPHKGDKSKINSPPTTIKGSNIQKIKSINLNPYLFCYTDDIWYYQINEGDVYYNLKDCSIPKILYKLYNKENVKNYKHRIKFDKEKVQRSVDKKIDSTMNKKSSLKSNSDSKLRSLDLKFNQSNQNSIFELPNCQFSKNRAAKSIYRHVSNLSNINNINIKHGPYFRKSQLEKCSFLKTKQLLNHRNYSNNENYSNDDASKKTNSANKTSTSVKSSPSIQNIKKESNKKSTIQKKITQEMVMKYFNNFKSPTWVPIQIILIETLLDIVWQDGTISDNVPSINVVPEMFDIDEYDFFPGDFVNLKQGLEEANENKKLNDNYGCVIKAKNDERIVTVQWFKNQNQKGNVRKGKIETCGSYDIKGHKSFHYHVGDIVAISNKCSKTSFPAGSVKSVNPKKGRLKIVWHTGKETQLFPIELSGVVWDLVSDDLFSTSEESMDLSYINANDTEKIHDIITVINNDSKISNLAFSIILELLVKVVELRESLESQNSDATSNISIMKEDILNLLNQLKNYSSDESVKYLHDLYFDNLFDEKSTISTHLESDDVIAVDFANSIDFKETRISNQYVNFITLEKLNQLEKSLNNWIKIKSISDVNIDKSTVISSEERLNYAKELHVMNESYKSTSQIYNPSSIQGSSWMLDSNESVPQKPDTAANLINKHLIANEDSDLSIYQPIPNEELGFFEILNDGSVYNKFSKQKFGKSVNHDFRKAWTKDYNMLTTCLPKGIWVKNFEERIDLFSVMIEGPKDTPFEYSLFFFDIHLPLEYPKQPPIVHFISFSSDKVNPNLYPDGRVCLSLLGTWIGVGSENWNPKISNIMQILISIQGLILVSEPYFNEAGYENKKNTEEGISNSKKYNESIITSLINANINLLENPPKLYENEVKCYYKKYGKRYIRLLKFWVSLKKEVCDNYLNAENSEPNTLNEENKSRSSSDTITMKSNSRYQNIKFKLPTFSLTPVSQGFILTLSKYIKHINNTLQRYIN